MSDSSLIKYESSCMIGQGGVAAGYCFGDLSGDERSKFEAHLLECAVCWNEVLRLAPAVELIRQDRRLSESFTAPDMLVAAGASSRLQRIFGGHAWHVLAGCGLYASLYSVALLLEVSYRFDQYRRTAMILTPIVFVWILITSLLGLGADWKAVLNGRSSGLLFSSSIFVVVALLLYIALGQYLPNYPITEANFPAYPAHGAYLKDTYYFLPLAVVFLLLPYHFVVTMQRELQAGRYHLGLALLMNERWSVVPGGAVYLRIWWLGLILLLAFVVSLALTSHLFENLKPNAYTGLFMQLVQWRLILYFALGVECLLWYYRLLNGIKRECLGAVASAAQTSKG